MQSNNLAMQVAAPYIHWMCNGGGEQVCRFHHSAAGCDHTKKTAVLMAFPFDRWCYFWNVTDYREGEFVWLLPLCGCCSRQLDDCKMWVVGLVSSHSPSFPQHWVKAHVYGLSWTIVSPQEDEVISKDGLQPSWKSCLRQILLWIPLS